MVSQIYSEVGLPPVWGSSIVSMGIGVGGTGVFPGRGVGVGSGPGVLVAGGVPVGQ